MKKVILLGAVALMSASVFVSCGPSEEEKKKMQDSLEKMMNQSLNQISTEMNKAIDSTVTTTTTDTTKK